MMRRTAPALLMFTAVAALGAAAYVLYGPEACKPLFQLALFGAWTIACIAYGKTSEYRRRTEQAPVSLSDVMDGSMRPTPLDIDDASDDDNNTHSPFNL